MRKTILVLALSFATIYSVAQCNQTVAYFSGKAEFLDNTGKVERSEEGKVVLKVSPTSVMFTHNDDDDDALNGAITDFACDWKEPFKTGKTTFTAGFINKRGERNDASISIEGKDTTQEILINFKAWGKTLKLITDSYKVD